MEAPWLFWLLLLGCPGYPTASVECIFGNITRNLIQVIHEYTKENLCFPFTLVEYLPDDFHPGPDFFGVAGKPVIIVTYLGIASFAIFIWSYVFAVKHRLYQANLQQMLLTTRNCMEENTKILEKISNWEKKINESKEWIQETKKNNDILSDEVNKLKVNIKTLEEKNERLADILEQTQVSLQCERLQNANNQDLILEKEKIIASLKDSISKTASDMSEVKNALLEARITEAKAKAEEEQVWKENAQPKAQEEQSQQENECQRKEQSDFQEQTKALENTQKDLEEALSETDKNIVVLTDCTSQLNCVSESASEDMNGELAGDMNTKMKIQMLGMMDVSQAKIAISAAEDDLKQLKFQLSDLMSANCNLQEYKKELEDDCSALRSAKAAKEEEYKTLKLKVEILDEIFEQQRMAAEEKLKLKACEQKESQTRLSEVEEKANMAAKEVQNYKRRIEEMEQKLQAAQCSFRQQIALHEEKAHDNWFRAHALERALVEQTREADYLKYRLEIPQNKNPQEEGGIKTPVLGRPDMDDPPQRDPGLGTAPLRSSSSGSSVPAGWTEEGKQTPPQKLEGISSPRWSPLAAPPEAVNMAARGPPPFPGPPFMHHPVGVGGPPPPMLRYGPPPPPWGPLGPPPPPPPPPFGKLY